MNFRHRYTSEAVCPYCGYEERDSWEFDDEDFVTCGNCDNEFRVERIVTVEYSTYKMEVGEDE